MALQAVKWGLPFPVYPFGAGGTLTHGTGTYVLDAASEKAAIIVRASVTKAIRKVVFRTATVTTGAIVDVRIETVTSAGEPSGTLFGTTTNVAHTIADGDDNAWLTTAALTADASLTLGDLFAVVIVNPSGSPGNLTISNTNDEVLSGGFPYGSLFTTAWAAQSSLPLILIEYSDGSYEPVLGSAWRGTWGARTFNNGSAADECGIKFKVPFPCHASGCWVWVDADGDFTMTLFDSDGTTDLAHAVVTNAVGTRASNTPGLHFYPFHQVASLSANTYYRLALRPDSATSVISYTLTVPTAAAMDSFPGGQNVHGTTRVNAGAWTDTTTERESLGLLLSGFDDGVSAARARFQVGI